MIAPPSSRSRLLALTITALVLALGCSKTSPQNAVDSAAAAPTKALGFTPSNVDTAGFDLSKAGDFVTDSACTIDSENLAASCGNGGDVLQFKVGKQSDGSKVGIYVAKTIKIPPGTSLTVSGHVPIVLIALDTIDIGGQLIATAAGDVGVAGGATQSTTNSKGGGMGGGGAGSNTSAAGGGSYCGVGGSGAVESGTAATGGAVYGSTMLVPLVGGSSGGAGSTGVAGAGGGAIALIAGTSINIGNGALVNVGGGGGGFGGAALTQGANGGGSGGAILIESVTVTIAGTLAANGGGGGQGALGDSGDNAAPSDQPALGGHKVTIGSNGGSGSAAGFVIGNSGTIAANVTAGGGGGGAGRIRINTKSGAATITGAKISPTPMTACVTQGKLLI